MRNAKADEAAFPYPGVSGGMTVRQFVALQFASVNLTPKSGVALGESEADAYARRTIEDLDHMRRAFELADAFIAAQEVKP